jgi:wyosine [tRNA(Phe)-imidazoG37] synthetase (radical SAM superfamily)
MNNRTIRKRELKYIYGPVPSWRLGASLGIDPISDRDKICTFDCVYCQLGRTVRFTEKRKIYVPVDKIMDEINFLPPINVDYLTFSGRGEPTLAENLADIIRAVKKLREEKIAVLTNSSLLHKKEVREDLLLADFVVAKLDAGCEESFGIVNKPIKNITFHQIVDGIKEFRVVYRGKMALQVMFVEANIKDAQELSQLARAIGPDELQINTPLRPCGVQPLSHEEIIRIKEYFEGMNVSTVYEARKKHVTPISEKNTLIRRGKI